MDKVINSLETQDKSVRAWISSNDQEPGKFYLYTESPWKNAGNGTIYTDLNRAIKDMSLVGLA